MDLKNKHVLVLGMGVSGMAAARLLSGKGALVKVSEGAGNDSVAARAAELRRDAVPCETGGHTAEFCAGADMVVTSPGVDISALAGSGVLREGVEIIGELELGALFCPARIIAVTGTNGKSTTTELIGEILSRSGADTVVCGNIGNPLSGEVGRMGSGSVAVVEVSSFQLETVRTFRPYVAVLLNVTEDHYDRHGDYLRYKSEKFRLFAAQTADDWAVLHEDFRGDPMTEGIKSRMCFFSAAEGAGGVMDNGNVPLKGYHNMENVACSVTVARIMGVEDGHIRDAISEFRGLRHRFEDAGMAGGVRFIDDSKATNIDATKKALESVDAGVVLIAGGRDKGGDYRSILPEVRGKVKTMVVIGEARDRISRAFSGDVRVVPASDMAEAVDISYAEAGRGGTVILSPMCSSFDMFSSYKERGDVFRGEIGRLNGAGGKGTG